MPHSAGVSKTSEKPCNGKIKGRLENWLLVEPRLTLHYTPEKRDYVRASRTLAMKSSWFLVLVVLILLLLAGSAVILVNTDLGGPALRNVALILFLACLVYVIYFIFLIPIQLGKAYQANDHLQQQRTLVFWDAHLEMIIGERSVELHWKDLKRVVDGGNYTLLIFEGDQKVFPFIPKQAFDDRTKQAFLGFIQSKSIPVI
jgi:hypothetical protein